MEYIGRTKRNRKKLIKGYKRDIKFCCQLTVFHAKTLNFNQNNSINIDQGNIIYPTSNY